MKPFLLAIAFLALATALFAADATVTFTDNATNEDGFRIERNLNGGSFVTLQTLGISPGAGVTVQLTDTTLVQSSTQANKYCYRAFTFNSAGEAQATTPTPGTTDCKTIAQLITVPLGGSGLLVK